MSETKPYAFHYNDGSFIVYDLDEEDYKRISDSMIMSLGSGAIRLRIGTFALKDIRAVVAQKPVEVQTPSAEPELTAEEKEWYEQNKATWENFGKEENA